MPRKPTPRRKASANLKAAAFQPNILKKIFPRKVKLDRGDTFEVKNLKNNKTAKIRHQGWEAFLPPEPKAPKGHKILGGVPYKIEKKALLRPDIFKLPRNVFDIRPWRLPDWKIWGTLTPTNPCKQVPEKSGRVEIPVTARARMGRVSGDCARVYTVSNLGSGCVVNVITESVEATFQVAPHPNPAVPHPSGITPIVHPFTLGAINHKYKRLYVPASFVTPSRSISDTGYYVAVVDINPTSGTYLDTVAWIDCGWIPEEIDFTSDWETGVIANYMQGTATIFKASDNTVLADEVDGFPGAQNDPGDAYSRSVATANIPGIGNRAFLALSHKTPSPGLGMINLDDAAGGYPVTNVPVPGGVLGLATTPDHRHVVTIGSGGKFSLVKIDQTSPAVVKTIDLPTSAGQAYWAGIAVRPSGDMAFVCTGGPDNDNTPDTMATVFYGADPIFYTDGPTAMAAGTWTIDIKKLGNSQKPHLFITSSSGMVTIIPC